jgi:D-aspartate ligase
MAPPGSEATLAIVDYYAPMRAPSIAVKVVTSATTLTAFRDADPTADLNRAAIARGAEGRRDVPPQLGIQIYSELTAVESLWRRFESVADCTAFQTFDWLAAWHRHVGSRAGARPTIIVGRFSDDEVAFILPLCVMPKGAARRLCWLGQDLCDYNAPLLARDFAQRVPPDQFLAAWRQVLRQMQHSPELRHDWIEFEKMPREVGTQLNPFIHLGVTSNASGAHSTRLGDAWETFYVAKRSSATRRGDRAKRRHMSEYGEIRFVTASDPDDARRTLEILMEQKSRSLARKGIADIFDRPGHREFFLDLASDPKAAQLLHISRIEIGAACAAANLGIVFGGCYYHVLASFADGPVSRYGPGTLHLRELMAHAIELGLSHFDFTIGDEPYKLEWSDTELELHDFAAAVTRRGVAAFVSSTVRRRIKRFIKQTPFLWASVLQVRAAIGSLSRAHLPAASAAPTTIGVKLKARSAPACVMGDMDLLRPLALAGIPCAVVARPNGPALYSRHTRSRLVWRDDAKNAEQLLDALVSLGKAQPERPVLFYQEDDQTLLVSRFRERLEDAFRFVVADAGLIEDLLDKARFQELAERNGLPVPAGRRFDPAALRARDLGLRFPLIIKPRARGVRWDHAFGLSKALCVESAGALASLWPQLVAFGADLMAQELILGAEDRIESYHCYVDHRGAIAGEFTGRKIRTYPVCYGHTTALEITDAADVRRCGRAIAEKLALTGVAKMDFKRERSGSLRLLEINPRFNLWHHAGAVAGVNIPALVHADLTGSPRPPVGPIRSGIRWCRPWKDFPAARAAGMPLTTWLSWAFGCETKSSWSWDDPAPFLRATFHRLVSRR